jgi:LemA protein
MLALTTARPAVLCRTLCLLVAGAMLAGCGINAIPTLQEQAQASWSEVLSQYQRRADLIPNLVNTVRGAMEFERDTLEAVIAARTRAVSATGPADAAQKEGELTQALGRLFALAENYPQLTANANVRALQEELSATENKIGFARQFYNDIATKYNTAIQVVPNNIIAGFGNFKPAELFEIKDEAERAVPTVDLSMKS